MKDGEEVEKQDENTERAELWKAEMRKKFQKEVQPSVFTAIDDLDSSLRNTAQKFGNFAMTTNERLKGIAM